MGQNFLAAVTFTLIVSLAVSTIPALGGELTPQQLAGIGSVGSAVITGDGQFIAYTRIVPEDPLEDNVPSQLEMHVVDRKTGEERHIEIDNRVGNLSVRPGHRVITFTTRGQDDDAVSLYELDPETGDYSRLYQHETNISGYSWAPTGDRFSFTANEQLDRPDNPLPYEPTVYEENLPNREAFIVEISGDDLNVDRVKLEGSVYLMEWSPDGALLAVSETPTPHIDDYYMFQQVRIIDGSTGELRNNINNSGKLGRIAWSPDGDKLALLAGNSINDPIDGRIMVVSSNGGTPENIYPGFKGKFEHINWTGADEIRFIASESTTRSYGVIRPDGSGMERKLGPDGPIWNSFNLAEDGTAVFVAQTPEHPSELFLKTVGSEAPERLTHTNPWLEDVQIGRQVVVSYEARDGRNLEGLLIYPVDEGDGGPYPTIVMVHGGPEAHYSNGWLTGYSLPGQLAASRGLAVFYPNYRGSTGRGLEFVKSSQADLAGAEFDDIVDGVDYLIDEGITDASRVGVTGGSYGGYATAWMSTRYSHRFAAGVMFVGISNNISKWGTSDIPEELYLVHSRTRIWDNWMGNLKRSPVYHVDNSQTPLLIMHGEEDTRVHPSQSLELYRHIKVRKPDVPVRLIWYPGEGHGNVRSTSRFDYNLRMMQWFETYLSAEDAPEMPDFYLDLEALGVELSNNRSQ